MCPKTLETRYILNPQQNDFSKAFDKVSELKLLSKRLQHGVEGNPLNLIIYFLVGRTQVVVLNGERSPEVPVTSDVLLGSFQRPLPFRPASNIENITVYIALQMEHCFLAITVNLNWEF